MTQERPALPPTLLHQPWEKTLVKVYNESWEDSHWCERSKIEHNLQQWEGKYIGSPVKEKKNTIASPADGGKTGSQLKLMQAKAEDGVSVQKQHLSSLPVVHEVIQPAWNCVQLSWWMQDCTLKALLIKSIFSLYIVCISFLWAAWTKIIHGTKKKKAVPTQPQCLLHRNTRNKICR